ncbi:hypothetical protein RintRC_3690 [Richelia intracellularis]|nr:hypothetical protein RintRC_3690 [Richelia intracellularis]
MNPIVDEGIEHIKFAYFQVGRRSHYNWTPRKIEQVAREMRV